MYSFVYILKFFFGYIVMVIAEIYHSSKKETFEYLSFHLSAEKYSAHISDIAKVILDPKICSVIFL